MQKFMNVVERFGWRLFWSALFTVLAFWLVQPITVATGVPEAARLLPALAVLYWLDMSITLGRVIFTPKVSHQYALLKASANTQAWLITLNTLFRLGAMLWVIYAA